MKRSAPQEGSSLEMNGEARPRPGEANQISLPGSGVEESEMQRIHTVDRIQIHVDGVQTSGTSLALYSLAGLIVCVFVR